MDHPEILAKESGAKFFSGLKPSYADLIFQAIQEKGGVRTPFFGKSMFPTLKEDTQISIEKIRPEEVKLSEIILYRKGGSLVAHRVIRILRRGRKRFFITKGDNQLYADIYSVPEEDLLGLVSAAFENGQSQKNILVKSCLIGMSYVLVGRLTWFSWKHRNTIPRFIRTSLSSTGYNLFLFFKKVVNCIYSGVNYGPLFFRRGRSSGKTIWL